MTTTARNTPFKALMTAGYPIAAERFVEARDWYSRLLGIPPYFDQPFYVGFNVAGYELGMWPKPDGEAASQQTGVIGYWGSDDLQRIYARLLELGATTIEAPHEVGGDIWICHVRDPFGNFFGVIQNPHFPNTAS